MDVVKLYSQRVGAPADVSENPSPTDRLLFVYLSFIQSGISFLEIKIFPGQEKQLQH